MSQLKDLLEAGTSDNFLLLDVRMNDEFAFCNIGGENIPMPELPARMDELPEDKSTEIAVLCRSGGRSARMTRFLIKSGYPNAVNVAGGILAWSREIDATVPTY